MNLEHGKKYMMVKASENKAYPCVVNQVETNNAHMIDPQMYVLDILTTKTFVTAFYDAGKDLLYSIKLNPLIEWKLTDYVEKKKECHCGGLLTYGSYHKEFHSDYCPIAQGGV